MCVLRSAWIARFPGPGSNPGLLRLWHWQPDALTTWLDLIHSSARSHAHGKLASCAMAWHEFFCRLTYRMLEMLSLINLNYLKYISDQASGITHSVYAETMVLTQNLRKCLLKKINLHIERGLTAQACAFLPHNPLCKRTSKTRGFPVLSSLCVIYSLAWLLASDDYSF